MTRWMCILVLAACGGDDGNNDMTDGGKGGGALACNAVTYCSTWSANDEHVTPPEQRGGTISDGIYRLERGTFSVQLLEFEGDHVNRLDDSFDNRSGTYTTAGGMISFSYAQACDKTGTKDDASMWNNRPYFVDGDTLQIGMGDSGTGIVWYEYKKIRLDQICEEDANVQCRVTNCSCAAVTDGFGTVENGLKSCSSN
jgi:hypothetical protein